MNAPFIFSLLSTLHMFRPYFGHHQGYTNIVTSLFTHSLGINVEHYAVYSNWQSPIPIGDCQLL
jgi:hypothetical protein